MNEKSDKGISLRTFLEISLSLAISIGMFDITFGFMSKPEGHLLNDFLFILASSTAAAILFFFLYCIFFFIIWKIKKALHLSSLALAISIAVFIAVFYSFLLCFRITTFHALSKNPTAFFLFFIISFFISLFSYFAVKMLTGDTK
ncbi:MAG: hypothetical protein D6734_11505, partial [Candidatus Schekmanbacteria bacterium]